MNIYNGKHLKYPLTESEMEMIDQVWKFAELFNFRTLYINDYRSSIISIVKPKYSIEQFMEREDILNKFFWNLRWLIFPLWTNENMTKDEYKNFIDHNYKNLTELPQSLLLCEKMKYNNRRELQDKIDEYKSVNNYYRSFINKLVLIDDTNNLVYTKPIEGSSKIFDKNYFNLLTSTILTDRKLYEEIMSDPYKIKTRKIKLPEFYYEYDYPFPNLNFCAYNVHNDEERANRIRRLYYVDRAERNWYKLVRNIRHGPKDLLNLQFDR